MYDRASVIVLFVVTCFCFLQVTKALGNFPQSGTLSANSNFNFNGGIATNTANNLKNIPIVPANIMSPNVNGNVASNRNGVINGNGAINGNGMLTGTVSQPIFNTQANTLTGMTGGGNGMVTGSNSQPIFNTQGNAMTQMTGGGVQSSQFGNPGPAFVIGNVRPQIFFTQSRRIGNSELGGTSGGFEANVGFFPEDDIGFQEPQGLISGIGSIDSVDVMQAAVYGLAVTRALFSFFDFFPPTSTATATAK